MLIIKKLHYSNFSVFKTICTDFPYNLSAIEILICVVIFSSGNLNMFYAFGEYYLNFWEGRGTCEVKCVKKSLNAHFD